MRLIDADRLETILLTLVGKKLWRKPRQTIMLLFALDIIRHTDTVKAEPVRHGEWLESESGYSKAEVIFCCSQCKDKFIVQKGDKIDFNYCPNCGAKMDGGDVII